MLDNVIHAGAEATLTWLTLKDPGLKPLLDKAYGYAVFPAVGRASVVLGGARGHGEVFEHGKPIGFSTLSQMTVGMQVGGQTFSELILFNSKDALETFKKGKVSFTANASAVLVNAGATGTSDFKAVVAKAYSRGGMLLEASIGGQKFKFHKHLGKSKKGRKEDAWAERRHEAEMRDGGRDEAGGTEAEMAGAEEKPEEGGERKDENEPAEDEEVEAREARLEDVEERGEDDRAREADSVHGIAEPRRTVRRSRPQGHNGSADVEDEEVEANTQSVGMRARAADSGRRLVGKVAHFVSEHGGPHGLNRVGFALAAKRHPLLLGKPIHLLNKFKEAATGLELEAKLGPVLSHEVDAAVRRMTEHDPGLKGKIDKAYGYAVFPLVGKATAALGVGFGRGQVFERGKLIGYAGIVQLTLGVQVGGQTYDELILFENEGALERFKNGKLAFAMNASAVLVKAGAAATTNYASGTAVFVHPEGGLMLELGLGAQKFIFRRKFLGAPGPKGRTEKEKEKRPAQLRSGAPELEARHKVLALSKHAGDERVARHTS
ncbi:MAG: hypothetical protein K0S65_554 [Labilithrix sp.]|nr:hypothetical protein [Labilithrix sp.]